eukprot:scaffold16724_cov127-Isochrysis_galbana.AAC.4
MRALCSGRAPLLLAALTARPASRLCGPARLCGSVVPPPLAPAGVMIPAIGEPPHPAGVDPEALLRSCEVSHTRGSGPGGQHRNKVSTAVVLKHTPTGISASASESRSQQQNHRAALRRLRLRLALRLRCEPAADGPSPLWRGRLSKQGRLSINEEHIDFPTLLAEALDHVWLARDVRAAAEALGVSTSQLCKLLSREPPALAWVNDLRRASGLPPLRV